MENIYMDELTHFLSGSRIYRVINVINISNNFHLEKSLYIGRWQLVKVNISQGEHALKIPHFHMIMSFP